MFSTITKAFATFAVAVILGVGGLGSLCIVGGHALTSEAGTSAIELAYTVQPSAHEVTQASEHVVSAIGMPIDDMRELARIVC